MPDPLSTALSGMVAFQRAMEMTGHNIANVNTDGYSRQVAEFATRPGQPGSNGYIGTGTKLVTIKRVYDDIIGGQLNASSSSYARFGAMEDLASRLDTLLADPSTGLNAQLQSFFNAVQDIANDPASLPTRQALLGEADGLVLRFSELDRQLGALDGEIDQRIGASIAEINQLAGSIAVLNDEIVVGRARTGQPPNDLMDERDRLVRELAGQISVSTVMQDDGAMNVFIGSGQSLVLGTRARQLGTQPSEFNPTRSEVTFIGTSGQTPISNALTGGQLGGLLEFRANLLDPARQSLGETAQAVALSFNEQHAAGMDLYGNLGGDFFTIDGPNVLTSNRNTGSGNATATIADLGALSGGDYVLEYDGAAYQLSLAGSGQAIAMSGSGTAADPFLADGLAIVTAGAPAAGDRLLIRPAADSSGKLTRSLTDPQGVAMAAPTRTAMSLGNLGSATISPTEIVDRSDPGLLSSATIEFTGPATYSVNGAGAFAYVSGEPITLNGSQFAITGTVAVGDRFTLEANTGASGDNRNGLKLADIQAVGLLDGGTVSINESYGQLVGNIGSATRQVQANFEAQGVVLTNAENAQLAKSGVNLDEEAANLLRYQQAYQAVAQVVSVANTLFETLLAATRR